MKLILILVLTIAIVSGEQRAIVCESETLRLDCGSGRISIINAFYGRTDRDTCADYCATLHGQSNCQQYHLDNYHCFSCNARDVIVGACDGSSMCSVNISNDDLNGDPCGGIYKYAVVYFNCV